jgi:hypothetical protein
MKCETCKNETCTCPPVEEGFFDKKKKYFVFFRRHGAESGPLEKIIMAGSSMLDVTKRAVSKLGDAAVYQVALAEGIEEVPLPKGKVVKVEGIPVKLKQATTVQAKAENKPLMEKPAAEPKVEEKPKLDPQLAKRIGQKLGVEFNKIPFKEFYNGIRSEVEHKNVVDPVTPENTSTRDWVKYAMIALEHLKERPDYYSKLATMEKEPIDTATVDKEIGEELTPEKMTEILGEVLTEMHYPPKALDYNKLTDPDGFWGWSTRAAAEAAGLNPIPPPFKAIGTVILWLNMAAQSWEQQAKAMRK